MKPISDNAQAIMDLVLSSHVKPLLVHLQTVLRQHPRTSILTSLIGLSVPWLVRNYRAYCALGPIALPSHVVGWCLAMMLKPFGRETLSTAEYDRDPNKDTWLIDPASIPERRGSRPITGWHFVPHRQLDRIPNDDFKERLDVVFKKHARSNPTLVEVTKSPHERRIDAMVIHSSIPSPHNAADQGLREIVHVHATDHSLHVHLSPQDCKLVIERGWGERHPLSGVARVIPLPKENLLIYAPRDEEELGIVERIIVASIGYMTNSRKVE